MQDFVTTPRSSDPKPQTLNPARSASYAWSGKDPGLLSLPKSPIPLSEGVLGLGLRVQSFFCIEILNLNLRYIPEIKGSWALWVTGY